MAPESEREQWIQEGYAWESCRKCRRNHKLGECTPKPDKPTLPCSEVVERLVWAEVLPDFEWNRNGALKILDSWRERRVQELEMALEFAIIRLLRCKARLSESKSEGWPEEAGRWAEEAEKALAKSDGWREQIRKGAKHE